LNFKSVFIFFKILIYFLTKEYFKKQRYIMIAEDDPEKETLWKDKLGSPKLPTRVLTQHS